MSKLWGGRFKKKTNPLVEEFTKSIHFDKRLAGFDCLGSIAHAEMLGKCKIIPKKEAKKIISALQSILTQIKKGGFKFKPSAEDVHTAIQDALYKKIGKIGCKLHTARSRNDQIALDIRMYCKEEIGSIVDEILKLKKSILSFARKNANIIVPGFTHLQNAQPVLLSHQLLAYCEMLDRDIARLSDCKKRVDVLPLGACAISGTSLPIDRKLVAKRLGFSKIAQNSIDAVSDRDFVIEFIFALSVLAMHLSRLAEDFIILNSQAFGLLEIGDEICTGSSMMPQKKNPDVLELVRGKSGELYGSLVEILTIMKGLPLSYNRDMQQDKEPLFSAVDNIIGSLQILALFFKDLRINKKRAGELLQDEALYATDIMEYLVRKGVALRDAHEIVGKVMLYCSDKKLNLSEVPLRQLRFFSSCFNKDVYDLLDAKKSVNLKKSYGGTSPKQVKSRLKTA